MNEFVYFESPQIPLQEVPYGDLKANITDPTTGKPYKGIVLEGVFAQFSNEPNNNKRIYSIPEYLVLLEKLKKQILSSKGVYGELEHPEKYSINFNNVSHKIIDVWYDEKTLTVYGRIILLDTPKGKIAQEIVKSGGQLAISARAAGEEIKQKDGTFRAVPRLLTTYDLVYHPGFSAAVLEFKELNESQNFLQNAAMQKQGFAFMISRKQFNKIPEMYANYINMNESTDEDILERRSQCFLEWFGSKLNEEQIMEEDNDSKEKREEEFLEKNEAPDEKEKEEKLSDAVDKELKESQAKFFDQITKHHRNNKFAKTLDKHYCDNSAGFVTDGISTSLSQEENRKGSKPKRKKTVK